jgi:TonB family protein
MKKILITIAFIAACTVVQAQQPTVSPKKADPNADIKIDMPLGDTKPDTEDPNKIFTSVEQIPVFPGGFEGFSKYLAQNIHYPADAVKNKVEGKVFLTFVVERNGSLADIKVLRGVSPDIDAEALRVMKASPHWRPGIQNGRPVRVQFSVPISFKLSAQSGVDPSKRMDSIMNLPAGQKIFSAVEQEPTPPGGMGAFYDYITRNTVYPKSAKDQDIQGKVFLTFTVEKDGSLTNIKVLRGLSTDVDAEAIRVLKNAPKWKPGIQNGRAVRVQYNIPISFPPQKID